MKRKIKKVIRTGSHFLLIAGLCVTGLFLTGCGAEFFSLTTSNHIREDAPFIRFIGKNIGTDWYGIYIQKDKVGYLKSTCGREKSPDGIIYKIQLSGTVQIPSQTDADGIKLHSVATFMSQPPFSMIYFSDRMMHKEDISETKIVRTLKGYEARITQGGDMRIRIMGAFEYSLKDYTTVQEWITRDPRKGAQITYPYLNTKTLKLEEKTACVTGIHKAIVSGVETILYDVITMDLHGFEVQEKFGADGKAFRTVIGGVFEYRLEPKSLATHTDVPVDFFVKNTVAIDRPLGHPARVALLKLSFDSTSGAFLDNAPGQSVVRDPTDGSVIVIVNPGKVPLVSPTTEEIKKNLAANIDIPANHPTIIRLAHNAVGDAGADSEKLSRLVKFVYRYIEDDYTANPLTVMDIVKKRRGDCSEHAQLFTTMARALGIPCRTVGGLVYLGDEFQEFGLHAWNEAVIGGVWVPIDPTWGKTLVDATHIRFSVDISKEWQVMTVIPKMKIKVLYVEHTP